MSDDANISEPPDPRIARTEAGLCALAELRQLGMVTARAKSRQACRESEESEAPSEAPRGRDSAEVFERVSRGVRCIVALEARLGDYLAALVAGDPSAEFSPKHAHRSPYSDDPPKPERDRMERRMQIRGHVLELTDPDSFEEEECERIYNESYQRLYESERYDALLDLPLKDAVEAICRDLGVRPQYERWEGLDWPAWRQNTPPPEPGPESPPEPPPETTPQPLSAPSPPSLSGGEPAGESEIEDALTTVGTPPWPPP
jgi:hypothetical protein